MIVHGIVVEIARNVQIKKRSGGTYPGSRLVYRDNDGNIKEQCFHEKNLEYANDIADSLNRLSTGMAFQMEKKKEGDFWNVVSITIGSGVQQEDKGKVMPETRGRSDGVQTQIVRQSSLGHAVATLTASKKSFTSLDVMDLAKIYEHFVHTGNALNQPEVVDTEESSDIPY